MYLEGSWFKWCPGEAILQLGFELKWSSIENPYVTAYEGMRWACSLSQHHSNCVNTILAPLRQGIDKSHIVLLSDFLVGESIGLAMFRKLHIQDESCWQISLALTTRKCLWQYNYYSMWALPVIIFPKALKVPLPLPRRWQKRQPKELHMTMMGHYLSDDSLPLFFFKLRPIHPCVSIPLWPTPEEALSPRITARAQFPLAGYQEAAGGSHFAVSLAQGNSDICTERPENRMLAKCKLTFGWNRPNLWPRSNLVSILSEALSLLVKGK